jgi:general secretion pathway protein C
MKRLDLAADTKPAVTMGAPGAPGGGAAAMPANLPPGVPVPEPPMSPGPVQQPPPQPAPSQEYATPGDVGQHDAPPPANPNSAPAAPNTQNNPNLNNPNANNPAPAPVQMPPPTRPTGSPVGGQPPSTQ